MSKLCNFLELEMTAACRQYLDEKINTAKIAQHQENDPKLVKEVENRIGNTLARYGFLKSGKSE